jgi:hypothetical protein
MGKMEGGGTSSLSYEAQLFRHTILKIKLSPEAQETIRRRSLNAAHITSQLPSPFPPSFSFPSPLQSAALSQLTHHRYVDYATATWPQTLDIPSENFTTKMEAFFYYTQYDSLEVISSATTAIR